MKMSRARLSQMIGDTCDSVKKMFVLKNEAYGNDEDALYNFRQTANRFFPNESVEEGMFRSAMFFASKHFDTLAKNGIYDKECSERLTDIIVYMSIAKAIHEEHKQCVWGPGTFHKVNKNTINEALNSIETIKRRGQYY